MSVSMTIDAVRARHKTVTRRHPDTWRTLWPGDRLTLVEKGMGLPKGAKQVVICEVEVTDVRIETLGDISSAEVDKEGVILQWADHPDQNMSIPEWFARWWAHGHGHPDAWQMDVRRLRDLRCRRIEWRYLDEEADRA